MMRSSVAWWKSRCGRVAAAASSGVAARILSSFLTLVSLPLALRYLGAERFGIWVTITSTMVILNLLDFGVASTLTNHAAHAFACNDKQYAARYTTNAIALTLSIGLTAAMIFALAWSRINWMALFNVSASALRIEVSHTVAAAAALMLLGLPASLVNRLFAGYQEVHLSNLVIAAGAAANLLGLLLGIALQVSMPVLFVLSAGCATLCNSIALFWVLFWYKPWLLPRQALVDLSIVRELLASGSGFFLIQIAGAVVFSSDNLVVSHYLGAAQVTPYSVTWRLVGFTAILQSLVFPALWPAYAEAYARGDYDWMRWAFGFTLRATLALNLACAVTLLVIGKTAIRWWAGPAAVPSTLLLAAMALWAVICGFMTAESCLLAAVNRTREQGILSVAAAAVNLALSIVLVKYIGSVGVIAGTILSYLIVLVVPQSLMVRRFLHSSSNEKTVERLVFQLSSFE